MLAVIVGLMATSLAAGARETDRMPDSDHVDVTDSTIADRAPARDVPADRPSDRPVDRATDRASDRVTDRPSDRVTDRPVDRVTDRPSDHRPLDRCVVVADNPRRCIDHAPEHDVNIRHLIWRLIKAQEWEKLFRLLHRLGLI